MAIRASIIFASIVFLFVGCAETRIYENGQLAMVMQGDASNVTFQTSRAGTSFHADAISHSTATTAAYGGATKAIGAIASGVATGLAIH